MTFKEGRPFEQLFDVVIGADVAEKLDYQLNDEIILAHGLGQASFSLHDDYSFRVVGILQPTGTPVDQALSISLQGMEAIHLNWKDGVKLPGVIPPSSFVIEPNTCSTRAHTRDFSLLLDFCASVSG